VAEQLRIQQIRRKAAQLIGTTRTQAPREAMGDGCQEFLARAGLAEDQERQLCRGPRCVMSKAFRTRGSR